MTLVHGAKKYAEIGFISMYKFESISIPQQILTAAGALREAPVLVVAAVVAGQRVSIII